MPTALTVPDLVLRLVKGDELTAAELDNNQAVLRDFCNTLADTMATALATDGSLNPDAVNEDAILDRAVTAAKLASTALPFFEDSGSANTFIITPSPVLTAYEDGQIFFIAAAVTNTGASTLNVNGLGVRPLRKRGGLELDSGDINVNQVFCAVFRDELNAFEIITGSTGSGTGSSGVGGGFSGMSTFAPADTDMPVGPSYPYAFSPFQHGLQAVPSVVDIALVCVGSEFGYIAGDVVKINEVINAAGEEVFTIQRNAISLTVTMTAAPYVRATATGTITAITLANWKLRVFASVVTAASTTVFPALNYTVHWPAGAFASGTDLWMASEANGTVQSIKINLANNNVTRLTPAATGPNHRYLHAAPFRRADLTDEIVFTSDTGIFRLPVTATQATHYAAVANGVTHQRRPVHIVEDSGNIVQVLAAGAVHNFGGETIEVFDLYAHAAFGSVAAGALGSPLNLRSGTILNASGVAGNEEFIALTNAGEFLRGFQYNRLKKRMYVITANTALLHIFELDDSGFTEAGSILEWWQHASRLDRLQYKKTLAIAGLGSADGVNAYEELYFIDVDLSTGDERAIVFSRVGNTTYTGSVTRVPWRE